MIYFCLRLAVDEDGATMVEYALMVALIASALVAIVASLGSSIGTFFTSIASSISGS